MPRSLSTVGRASLFAESTAEVWLCLMTIDPDAGDTLRFVNNNEGVVSRGQTFVPFPFTLELPGQDAESPGEARIVVDNIDRQMVVLLRGLSAPPAVLLEVVLASNPDQVEIAIPDMTLRVGEWDKLEIRGTLRFDDLVSEPVSLTMTPARMPGLF